MPQEFSTVSASSYDSSQLAVKLTEKSAEGWDVVGIVNTSTEVTAFLSREAGSGTSSSTTPASSVSTSSTDPASGSTSSYASSSTPAAAAEPSGWGTAPAASTTPSYTSTPAATPAADPSGGYSSQSAPAAAQPAAAATPAVPAGWYADPAGRFDLRYWDGSTWTEHVSRAGQQFTDPPVA
ncbi:MAG: DUF2510 domain-containing protein [Ilumatobacteraceae bacterium]